MNGFLATSPAGSLSSGANNRTRDEVDNDDSSLSEGLCSDVRLPSFHGLTYPSYRVAVGGSLLELLEMMIDAQLDDMTISIHTKRTDASPRP